MQPNGYQTSSSTIQKIIEKEGLDAFVVVEIRTIDEVGNVHDYETNFLVENNCAASEKWINFHNNTSISFGSDEFKSIMLLKYGVETPSKLPEVKDKQRKTNLEKYGVEYQAQRPEVQSKCMDTNIKRYGCKYTFQSSEIHEKSRKTDMERYGVRHSAQSVKVKDKQRKTNLEKYGVEYQAQRPEVQSKFRKTNLERYGVEFPAQIPENKEKMKALYIEKFEHSITDAILAGDFSKFEYIWDATDEVFLMGVYKTFVRIDPHRYQKITSNKNYKKYIDELSGKLYYINVKFTRHMPPNFKCK